MIGGVDRVHVPGQQHAPGGLGTHPHHQMIAARGGRGRTVRQHLLDGRGRFECDRPGERGERVREFAGHCRDSREIAGAAVDRRPFERACEDRRRVDRVAQPHRVERGPAHRPMRLGDRLEVTRRARRLEARHRIGAVVGGIKGARPVIARIAEAAERHRAARAGGRPVAIDHARADAVEKPLPQRLVAADQPCREAEAGRVGGGERGLEVGHAGDLEHRREDLLVGRGDAGDVEDGGADERGAAIADRRERLDRARAELEQPRDLRAGALRGAVGDQRAHVGLGRLVPRADRQRFGDARDLGDHGVAERALGHDQPPRARAALATGDERRLGRDRRRFLDVAIPHHQRVVAAEFEREDHVRAVGEYPAEVRPGARRAGEQQPVDVAVGERRAGVAAALQHLEHVLGKPRGSPRLGHRGAGRGGQFGRLEQHRVAREQRRDDVAVGQVAGEIVRPEHRHDPMRPMPQHRGAEPGRLFAHARALGLRADRDFDLGDHRRDFAERFPQRLAGLARDRLG